MQHRQEAFSEDRLKELSKDPTKVIYQPTYDTIFEPWSSRRVETAVRRIVRIAMGSADAEAARAVCERDAELKAFSELYQKFYEKFTTPSIAQNPEHVHVAMEMIRLHEEMRRGRMSETAAKSQVSDIALASLMRQAPGAPKPPSGAVVEEMD